MEKKPYEIRMKLRDFRQLFNSLDPAPFLERDLDDDASDYIVDSVKEQHIKKPMRIVIYLPLEQANEEQKTNIRLAIYHFFSYKLDVTRRKLKNHLEKGRKALVIGVVFLTIFLVVYLLCLH